MRTEKFSSTVNALPSGTNNACVPVALSIVSGTDVNTINDDMLRKRIRKTRRSGVYRSDWEPYISSTLGLQVRNVSSQVLAAGGKTVRTVTRVLNPNKRYLVVVRRHLLAVTGGQVHDWTNGRKHRVQSVLEILGADEQFNEDEVLHPRVRGIQGPITFSYRVPAGPTKPRAKRSKAATADLKQRAFEMFIRGYSVSRVASELNITYGNAHYYKRSLGVK